MQTSDGRIVSAAILALSILLAAALLSYLFRYDAQTWGPEGRFVLLHDRWLGDVKWCGGDEDRGSSCRQIVGNGYRPSPR